MQSPVYGLGKQNIGSENLNLKEKGISSILEPDAETNTGFQREYFESHKPSIFWRGLRSCLPICGLGKEEGIDGRIEEAEPLLKNEGYLQGEFGSTNELNSSEWPISTLSLEKALDEMPPEKALEKALSTLESRAALGDKLLQDAFLDAAQDENFQLTYFRNFENTNRYTFRWRLRQSPVSAIYEASLEKFFKKDIEEQEKKNAPGSPALEMRLFPSVNQNRRGAIDIPVTHVILHHTATKTTEETLNILRNGAVSAHYLIGRDGDLMCLVPDKYQSWHAGVSSWQGITNLNFYSVGIELVNTGSEVFTDLQIDKLLQLLEVLKGRHKVPEHHFISHADIAPGRKVDPNVYFPWEQLAEKGFGLWLKEGERQKRLPDDFKIADALSKIGYQVGILKDAIKAFSLHFLRQEKAELNEDEKLVLYSLAVKADSQHPSALNQNTIQSSINYA